MGSGLETTGEVWMFESFLIDEGSLGPGMQALLLAWTKVFGHSGVVAGPVAIISYEQKTSFRILLRQK